MDGQQPEEGVGEPHAAHTSRPLLSTAQRCRLKWQVELYGQLLAQFHGLSRGVYCAAKRVGAVLGEDGLQGAVVQGGAIMACTEEGVAPVLPWQECLNLDLCEEGTESPQKFTRQQVNGDVEEEEGSDWGSRRFGAGAAAGGDSQQDAPLLHVLTEVFSAAESSGRLLQRLVHVGCTSPVVREALSAIWERQHVLGADLSPHEQAPGRVPRLEALAVFLRSASDGAEALAVESLVVAGGAADPAKSSSSSTHSSSRNPLLICGSELVRVGVGPCLAAFRECRQAYRCGLRRPWSLERCRFSWRSEVPHVVDSLIMLSQLLYGPDHERAQALLLPFMSAAQIRHRAYNCFKREGRGTDKVLRQCKTYLGICAYRRTCAGWIPDVPPEQTTEAVVELRWKDAAAAAASATSVSGASSSVAPGVLRRVLHERERLWLLLEVLRRVRKMFYAAELHTKLPLGAACHLLSDCWSSPILAVPPGVLYAALPEYRALGPVTLLPRCMGRVVAAGQSRALSIEAPQDSFAGAGDAGDDGDDDDDDDAGIVRAEAAAPTAPAAPRALADLSFKPLQVSVLLSSLAANDFDVDQTVSVVLDGHADLFASFHTDELREHLQSLIAAAADVIRGHLS